MLNPLRSGFYAVQLLSHKVMRYAAPLFLGAALLASAVGARESTYLSIVLAVQVGTYLLAAISWLLGRGGHRGRLLALPHYFLLANAASAIAFYQFLRGNRYARWEPIRAVAEKKPPLNDGMTPPHAEASVSGS